MQKIYLVVYCLFVYQFNFAQDFHLSQIDKTIAMINPSLTGNYEGFEKLSFQHRNQWVGSGTQFTTSYGMAEFTFGKNKQITKSFLGLGLFYTNDVGGDSKLSLKSSGVNLSGNLPINKKNWISAGIQSSIVNRSADFSNLLFYSQWNGTQLDPSINSGESNIYPAYLYFDAGAGICYNYRDKSNNTIGGKMLDFQIGASFSHLNRANISFSSFSNDNLYIKSCFHTNFKFAINDRSVIEISVAQFLQGPHRETNAGVFYKAVLRESSRYTNLNSTKYFTIGSYSRFTGVLTPYCGIDFGPFKLGVSYDVEFGKISRAYRQSAEVSLSYHITKKSIFSSRSRR